MTGGIDTQMHDVEAPLANPFLDRAPPDSGLQQLLSRDDAVLPRRQRSDHEI